MYQVYRIDTYDAKSNSHSIGIREENWYLRKDKIFDNEEQAKEYVRLQNRKFSTLPTYLISLKTDKEKREFVDKFCFEENTPYLYERRYYLGMVSTKNLVNNLKQQGIIVTV